MQHLSDTPKKTLTFTRKPASTGASPSATVTRTGKRIIRRDDLPNVQRPGKGGKPPAAKAKPKKPPRKPQPKKQVTPPSELKMRELNDRLNGFRVWLTYQPLALGIEKQIFKLVNDECFPGASKKVVQKVLRKHTNHGLYLQAIQRGGARYTLDGAEEGDISQQHQQHAAETLTNRQQAQG
ncbi:ProQ/FINO family protein [Candidatus Thiothrix sp. Deng01]|uniref:ProQ/FINO family protein n=1 Tax=Candidatus Thiothrix phosphatis TaxID=3112415 RepID=A0ABU6CTV8_9GAMM|nr:ProQ/FINO family protein [Candidatus Thiothrix sp. Deng01]MEB4590240.1 ProQ/FINO family protein [Candidatus Thiothrix sp. Deng01]